MADLLRPFYTHARQQGGYQHSIQVAGDNGGPDPIPASAAGPSPTGRGGTDIDAGRVPMRRWCAASVYPATATELDEVADQRIAQALSDFAATWGLARRAKLAQLVVGARLTAVRRTLAALERRKALTSSCRCALARDRRYRDIVTRPSADQRFLLLDHTLGGCVDLIGPVVEAVGRWPTTCSPATRKRMRADRRRPHRPERPPRSTPTSSKVGRDINRVEARHASIFVAGWRPAIGWVSGVAWRTSSSPTR